MPEEVDVQLFIMVDMVVTQTKDAKGGVAVPYRAVGTATPEEATVHIHLVR